MSRTAFERIKAGLLDAIDYVEGRRRKGFRVWEIPPGEIKAAHKRLDLSQAQFADRFGFSVKNLERRAAPKQQRRVRSASRRRPKAQ